MRPLPFAVLALAAALFSPLASAREVQELASGWKFTKGEAAPDGPTAAWETLSLPHTWNAQDGQLGKAANPSEPTGYYRGPGWYALALQAPAAWQGKRVFLRIEAASLVAQTYFNGHLLGEHKGGFTAFCYELTPYLKLGADNEIRVRVDNSPRDDVPPLKGDFNINGGLYRSAQIIVTDPLCVTPLDYASPGVYLTPQAVSKESATVEARAMLSNGLPASGKVDVEVEIHDAQGAAVAQAHREVEVGSGKTEPVVQTLTLPQPHLWQGRTDPYLYSATVRLKRGSEVLDEVTQPLGLRTVGIDQAKGFVLNGLAYPVRGVNRHQERRDKGWALSAADQDEDAQLILDLGATAIRLAHYPQSNYFHTLCDKNGLLLWDEVSLVDKVNSKPEFADNAELQLRELIAQLYNHPSFTFVGLFNEQGGGRELDPLLERLKKVVLENAPTRIDVAASNHRDADFNWIPTAICFNWYSGWYGKGQPEDFGPFIAEQAQKYGKRIGMSEYGGGANPAQHQEGFPQKINQAGAFHPEEWQTYIHERAWEAMKDNPNLWGTFLWVMFDFSVSGRHEGDQPGLNDKGLVTQDRKTRKDSYYFYKANWNPEPMIYLASRRSTPRNQAETRVEVFSNCDAVELKVNGQSLGKVTPDRVQVARWEKVTLKDGPNQIEAIGTAKGKAITDHCEWVLKASTPP